MPLVIASRQPLAGAPTYVYMTSDRVQHRDEIMAETKEDAYSRLRAQKIHPIRVLAEGEAEPPMKIFAKKSEKGANHIA